MFIQNNGLANHCLHSHSSPRCRWTGGGSAPLQWSAENCKAKAWFVLWITWTA